MDKGVGARIQRLRERRDWSQLDLAEKVGINNSVLSRIESGKRSVRVEELNKFAEVFGVKPDYILGKDESRTIIIDTNALIASKERFDPFAIFELVDLYTDDEIIEKYIHTDAGKKIGPDIIRTHLAHIRFLKSQKK